MSVSPSVSGVYIEGVRITSSVTMDRSSVQATVMANRFDASVAFHEVEATRGVPHLRQVPGVGHHDARARVFHHEAQLALRPTDVAVDCSAVYWVNMGVEPGTGSIMRMRKLGGP